MGQRNTVNWRLVNTDDGGLEILNSRGEWIQAGCTKECPWCHECLGCLGQSILAELDAGRDLWLIIDTRCDESPDGLHDEREIGNDSMGEHSSRSGRG